MTEDVAGIKGGGGDIRRMMEEITATMCQFLVESCMERQMRDRRKGGVK